MKLLVDERRICREDIQDMKKSSERVEIEVEGYQFKLRKSGEGRAIVLIQTWHPYAKFLAESLPKGEKRQIITVDIPGYYLGRQKKPIRDMDLLVRLLDQVFEKMGLSRVDLIGQCLGGVIALKYAADYPERVGKVVVATPPLVYFEPLVNVSVRRLFGFLNKGSLISRSAGYLMRKSILAKLARFFDGYHGLGELVFQELRRADKKDFDDRVFFGILLSAFKLDLWEIMRQVKAPVLMVAGEKDMSGKNGKLAEVKKTMKDIRCEVIPRARHAVVLKQTKEFNRLVLDFLVGSEAKS